ncbi:hypothetical protein T439DRAFT_376387 [Meredithblackwellia eburnea MCA 4105]
MSDAEGGATRSDRQCLECRRRKKKCDKLIPCTGCVERGVQHLCRVDNKNQGLESSTLDGPQLAMYAITELQSLREGFEAYRTRMSKLEIVLSKALAGPGVKPVDFREFDHYGSNGAGNPGIGAGGEASTSKRKLEDIQVSGSVPKGTRSSFSSKANENAAEEADELEAGIALEFMALGRQRQFGNTADSSLDPEVDHDEKTPVVDANTLSNGVRPITSNIELASTNTLSPTTEYPDPRSWAAAAPAHTASRLLISHAVDSLGWLLGGVVHGPTIHQELEEFLAKGEKGFEEATPAWISLFFSLLVCGTLLCTEEKRHVLGLQEADLRKLSKAWFRCTIATLYHANFLEEHSLHSLQTICVLALGGRDAWSAPLVATLLSTGLSMAQDIGLHHLGSDDAWNKGVRHLKTGEYVKALVTRETQKRVFWSLIREEWYSIIYRRSYALRPSQITTPLPLNTNDWDLSNGVAISHPPSTFTVVSYLLFHIEHARCMQAVFEHMDSNPSPLDSFAFIQKAGDEIDQIGKGVPEWMRSETLTESMPPFADWMRTVWVISWEHKILTINRPFFHRALKGPTSSYVTIGCSRSELSRIYVDPRYEPSRKRSIAAAESILRAAQNLGECRVWTGLYHISAASFVLSLDLFQTLNPSTSYADGHRTLIREAIEMLQRIEPMSEIAERGAKMIGRLIANDQRAVEVRQATAAAQAQETSTAKSKGKSTRGANKRQKLDAESSGPSSTENMDQQPENSIGNSISGGSGQIWELPATSSASNGSYEPWSSTNLMAQQQAADDELFASFFQQEYGLGGGDNGSVGFGGATHSTFPALDFPVSNFNFADAAAAAASASASGMGGFSYLGAGQAAGMGAGGTGTGIGTGLQGAGATPGNTTGDQQAWWQIGGFGQDGYLG